MKVMHLFSGREAGGIASVVLPLLRELKGQGHNVSAVFLKEGPMSEMARGLGLDIDVCRRRHFMDFMLIARLASKIRRDRVDIVHTHSVSGNFYGRLASFFACRSLTVTSVHADTYSELVDATGSVLRARLWHWVDKLMSRFSRLLLANSEATKEVLLSKGLPCTKVRVLYNGIETAVSLSDDGDALRKELGISAGAKVVGSVGRLTGTKNYALFLRAAKIILQERKDVFFLLVGDGPERHGLEALARRLGIEDNLIFTGWSDDIDKYLAIMDVFVLTSVMEGFGLVLLEAMKFSLPVVSTSVGGVPEVVAEGETGLLIPSDNDGELAHKVQRLLADSALRKKLGGGGKDRLEEKFTLKKMAEKTMCIYKEVS